MMMLKLNALELAKNTFFSRWMVVVAGFFIMSVSGSLYAFGVYSGALKEALGYDQRTLNTVGFFKDFGNIGILAGIIADLAPPWVVLSIGVVFNTVGYLMIWLSVTHKIARPAIWQMYAYITIGGNSIAFTHSGALVTCVKNFPLHRGMIIGLLKGFLGLSTALLAMLYHAVYGNHPTSFILLIIYVPFAVVLAFMFFIRPMPVPVKGRTEDEAKIFYRLLIFELLVAGYLMLVILIQHTGKVGQSANQAFGVILVLIFCVPFGMVMVIEAKKLLRAANEREDLEMSPTEAIDEMREENGKKEEEKGGNLQLETQDSEKFGEKQKQKKTALERVKNIFKTQRIGEDFSIWKAIMHPDFWLLSIASTGGLGAGLMAMDNLGQLGAAYGYDADKTSTFVSLMSIWNCLGRVGAGFVSEFFLQRTGIARPFFFGLVLAISAVGHLAIALALPGALFVGSILIGLCFGAQWSLLHIIVSEIFGLKYYGTLQSIIAMASPLGTYLFSVRVAGYLYDRESDKQQLLLSRTISKDYACRGVVCYRTTFFIMCAVCVAACFLMMVVTWRTKTFYKEEVLQKLRAEKLQVRDALRQQEVDHAQQKKDAAAL